MRILITVLYSLFSGWWRRCFGSDGWELPVLKNRFVQHLIGFTVGFLVLWYLGYHWFQSAVVMGVLQGLYWARAVGMYQDIGRAGQPDKKMLKRYNDMWYNKFLNKWFSKCKYSVIYDWCGLTIRYTLPALLIAFILGNYAFIVAGFCVSSIYSICWTLYDFKCLKKLGPTELAEILAGVVTGLLLTL